MWFASNHRSKRYSIRKHIKAVNARLMAIKPTDAVSRLPSSLLKLSKYKASECETMMLLYSMVILDGFLPKPYLDHLALLVDSVYVLMSDKITHAQLDTAETKLKRFYNEFAELYHINYVNLNLHNIGEHLVEFVR